MVRSDIQGKSRQTTTPDWQSGTTGTTTESDSVSFIQQFLDTKGITDYLVHEGAAGISKVPDEKRVQGIWLEDAQGKLLLVLCPCSLLLDLSYLAFLGEAQYKPVHAERLSHIMHQPYGLLSWLATPHPKLCETRLLDQDSVALDFGLSDFLLELSSQAFQSLLGEVRVERFGIAVEGLLSAIEGVNTGTAPEHSFTSQRIYRRLKEAVVIPPLPQTAQKLSAMMNNPKATVDDLAALVETDPALAAQVIAWASSPHYAAPGRIQSVKDAISRALGFERVLNLALGLTMANSVPLSNKSQLKPAYWHEAIYTAMAVDGLVHAMPASLRPKQGLAYLSGLLHNFGYLILAYVFPPHFVTLCQYQDANPHLSPVLIEQYLLGIGRDQIGSWLMRNWSMPDELITAIYYQKEGSYRGEFAVYANLIHLASVLLARKGIGRVSVKDQRISDEVLVRLGLTLVQAEASVKMIVDAEAELRGLARQMQGHA